MAATDKPYRKQKTLDIVFAVSCILMLLSVLWMLVADYNRQFKAVQRTFRDVESVLNERQMLAQLPDPGDVEAARKLVADRRQARDDEKAKAQAKEQELTAKRDTATASYRAIKADFDSKSSFYNIEVGERDQEGISREVRKERAERVEARKEELAKIQKNLDDAQKAVDAADAEYQREITDKLTRAENDLSDAEDALKKLTGNFDRFAKQTVQKEWGFSDAFRSMPILDAFESPTKIKQIVLADLPIEYGSFKYVTRYDRCTSCHLAVDRVGFDHRTLTKLTRSENDARETRRAAVKAAVNDIIASVGEGLPKDARDQLAALDKAVDKGDVVTPRRGPRPRLAGPDAGHPGDDIRQGDEGREGQDRGPVRRRQGDHLHGPGRRRRRHRRGAGQAGERQAGQPRHRRQGRRRRPLPGDRRPPQQAARPRRLRAGNRGGRQRPRHPGGPDPGQARERGLPRGAVAAEEAGDRPAHLAGAEGQGREPRLRAGRPAEPRPHRRA